MANEEGESMLILTKDCKFFFQNTVESDDLVEMQIRHPELQDGVPLKSAYIKQVNSRQFVALGVKAPEDGDQVRFCFALSNPVELCEGKYTSCKMSLKTDVLPSSDIFGEPN